MSTFIRTVFTHQKYLTAAAAIIAVLLLLQIPFLQADPDYNLTTSRDANTDEGLYSMQIRNLINHHGLSFHLSDGMIKTPLFSATLYFPLLISGCSLAGGRLTVLIITLLIAWNIFRNNKFYLSLGLVSALVVFTEYHIFQYSHFCLTEMICTALIFSGLFFTVESDKEHFSFNDCLKIATCFSLSWYFKFQFVYAVVIPVLALMLMTVIFKRNRKVLFLHTVLVSGLVMAYAAFYLIIWYLPNKEFFHQVMGSQSAGKFASVNGIRENVKYLMENVFFKGYFSFYSIVFLFFIAGGSIIALKQKSERFTLWFICLACWIFIELHKLTMIYLPTRYLISLFFAISMFIALILRQLIFEKSQKYLTIIAVSATLMLAVLNIVSGIHVYQRRTFSIEQINNYFSSYNFANRPVIGAWAPSCTWGSQVKTLPVWYDYFNDRDVIKRFNPAIVIAEYDEEDSNQTYSKQGIRLQEIADSVKSFKVNRWDLRLYWIKDQRLK